jgi:DNA-binding transcriptional regulator YhcF (GntR family)
MSMTTDRVLVVAPDAATPVYEQIAGQIRDRIAAGELHPGDPLPSVRTLASDLGVNLNTVARAYRLLEEQGFLRIRDRSGAEVAAPAVTPDAAARERLAAELRDVVVRMRQAGFAATELHRLVDASSGSGADAGA